MPLPNPSMSFSPFAILTAEEMNDLVENIESLSSGVGIGNSTITTPKLNISKTVDTNGWTVYDFGNWKEYIKVQNFSTTLTAGQIAVVTIASSTLPTGMATIGASKVTNSLILDSFAYYFQGGLEMTTASTALRMTARNGGPSTITWQVNMTTRIVSA